MPVTEVVDGVERTYPCVESMTKLIVQSFFVRIWRDEAEVKEYDNSDLNEIAKEIDSACELDAYAFCQPHLLARRFAQAPRVSAVEVLDIAGDGIVLYVTW